MAVLHAKGGPAEDKQAEDSCSTFTASKHMDSALLLLYLSSLLAPPVLSVVATSLVGHLRTRAIPLNAPCHPEADGHLTGGLAISIAMSTAASNAISIARAYAIAMANSTASSNSGPSTIPHFDTTSMPGEETLPAVTCLHLTPCATSRVPLLPAGWMKISIHTFKF